MIPRPYTLSAAGIGFALVSALGFSTLGIFAMSLYSYGFSVPQTLSWRFTVASLFLWLVLGLRKAIAMREPVSEGNGAGPRRRKDIRNLLVLALFGFTPQAGLYFLTVKMLAPGITSLLLYLYPAFVLLLTALIFHRKPTKGQILALALSFLGCTVTFFKPGAYPILGLLLGVLVAIAYSIYLVWGEKVLAGFNPLFSTAVIMTVAGIVYWAWLFASGQKVKAPDTLIEWLFVVGIALVATVLPVTTLFAAMKRAGAANTSLVSTVEPVITVLLSAFFLGEELTASRIVGGLFIIGGVVALRLFAQKKV